MTVLLTLKEGGSDAQARLKTRLRYLARSLLLSSVEHGC